MAAMTSKFYYVCVIQYYSDQWSDCIISLDIISISNDYIIEGLCNRCLIPNVEGIVRSVIPTVTPYF